jgi:cytochrome P450 family 6
MLLLLIPLALLTVLLTVVYLFVSEKQKYFQKRGIVTPKYEFFFGHMRDTFFKRRHVSSVFEDMYREYKDKEQLIGFYDVITPYLLVIDPELVKQVLIKDFKHFRNNEFSLLVSYVNHVLSAERLLSILRRNSVARGQQRV